MITQIKALNTLNKDLKIILKCSQIFFLLRQKSVFLRSRTRDSTEDEIFQKVLVRFQQTRSQMKAYYYCLFF